ncbi:MAG: helix-turn-helix transcriptional regulator [Hyphomicrobiales bacterium]|nr:helix-turn-helix transcriptional regulator [Hyphomicrobiales bacterium]
MATKSAKFITTPAGEELVILSRADYDALCSGAGDDIEDAADAALYAERKAALEAGLDEKLPPEVSAAMLRGDTLLRAIRRWRGMTQLEIAYRTDLAQGYISDIETGRKSGTPETLAALARALKIDKAWLS